MLNAALLKKEIRSGWKLFLLFLSVLLLYTTIILSMFDPDLGAILADFEEAMPGIMSAFGLTGAANSSLTDYASSYLFGFIMILFPLVFSIILTNKVIARYVDNGAMAYLLAAPHKRRKIVFTQAAFVIGNLVLILLLAAVVGIIFCEAIFPGELSQKGYLLLHAGVLGLHLAISGIGFLASCFFNEIKYSYAVGAAIPIAGYLIQMISTQGEKFERARYLTFFTLFSPEKLLAGDTSGYYMVLALYIAGFAFYTAGCTIFTKKNLPI